MKKFLIGLLFLNSASLCAKTVFPEPGEYVCNARAIENGILKEDIQRSMKVKVPSGEYYIITEERTEYIVMGGVRSIPYMELDERYFVIPLSQEYRVGESYFLDMHYALKLEEFSKSEKEIFFKYSPNSMYGPTEGGKENHVLKMELSKNKYSISYEILTGKSLDFVIYGAYYDCKKTKQ